MSATLEDLDHMADAMVTANNGDAVAARREALQRATAARAKRDGASAKFYDNVASNIAATHAEHFRI